MPPRPPMKGPGAPAAKDPKKTLLRLLSYLKKHIFVLLLVMISRIQ